MNLCCGSTQAASRLALLEKRHRDTCPDLWKPCAKGFFFCAAPGPPLCLAALPLFTGAVILAAADALAVPGSDVIVPAVLGEAFRLRFALVVAVPWSWPVPWPMC